MELIVIAVSFLIGVVVGTKYGPTIVSKIKKVVK